MLKKEPVTQSYQIIPEAKAYDDTIATLAPSRFNLGPTE